MTVVLKLILFGLCYLKLMRKADPNCVGGRNVLVRYVNQKIILPILKGETLTRKIANSNHVIYLFEFKQCQYHFPYVDSTKIKFRYRINNYKSTNGKFRKKYVEKDLAIVIRKSELKQKFFHKHYCSEGHQGIENLSVTVIDQVEDVDSLRKKELYWINR